MKNTFLRNFLAFFILYLTSCTSEEWIIDTQEQWINTKASGKNIKIQEGYVKSENDYAVFTSVLKKFNRKCVPKSIVLKQSDNWMNWFPVENIGPSNLRNAPVLLAVGNDNYWIFGIYGRDDKKEKAFQSLPTTLEDFDIMLKTTPYPNQYEAPGGKNKKFGYHAWQSRDMLNWVHHGQVTEDFSRWVTSAEYVDGKTYIYYDYPNDQDPHLYIDEDLTDGIPGKNMGIVFKDPSNGSDCGVIRDKNGKFHIIYEDWSPINARAHSWDSPLAGHAVGPDGIHDFTIMPPVVDKRTKPTGEVREYKHPHWLQHPDWNTNMGKYDVHKPSQDAFGDWAAICIGEQYYLFADFDPANGHEMSVCWFTSPSLDKQFKFCGNIGRGHPDPDIIYAEGRFYLVTQMDIDYVSPGPWVGKVEVRVGVDTDKDGSINQWTSWQEVQESYDYIKGFAKQISRKPAKLDLTDLPKGYAFKFEFRTTKIPINNVAPEIDKVIMNFLSL